ncbi:hypothetical protein BXY41_10235 [Lacrimispora xylanisolvens]|uniref:UPF0246 protein BXY41_10235 n=1 Tax=Lacrimispora xylanisolvens TaxID=384636 RepID=A0A2S6HWG8_9FIRM|nr:peroxide stress protein YaaA [Hungatella xylanolytica]PPK82349.1 hypothetical protein BXY41_10235 [Hungatella xylanolytica]
MKIIISPAKKMNVDTDSMATTGLPVLLDQTRILWEGIKKLSYDEAKKLWGCNDKLAGLNYRRFAEMNLEKNITPAVLAYEGLQYQRMAPLIMTRQALDYLGDHLRILSGFYGILSPFDGVVPYRLEMQARMAVAGSRDLYGFWDNRIYKELAGEEHIIINLASKEYSQAVKPYLSSADTFVTCIFGELAHGKIKQKGTLAKMARGEMVRYMAENNVTEVRQLKKFNALGYRYIEELSTETEMTFVIGG